MPRCVFPEASVHTHRYTPPLLSRRRCLLVPALRLAAAASLIGTDATAQRAVRGVVVDSASGIGVAGAEVAIVGTTLRAATDQRGTFSFPSPVSAGSLSVRRLGFGPRTVPVGAADGAIVLRVSAQLQALRPVLVRAERSKYSGRLAGYYERLEHRSIGQFITRADLEREHPTQLTDMLQRSPGLHIVRGRPGAPGVRMRGRDCSPLIWLDGSALGMGDIDLDGFSPESLEGIELYLSASGAPTRFQAARGRSECGTILLWSRRTDAEPRPFAGGTAPADLEQLLVSRAVFSVDQVDLPASLDSAASAEVEYPAAMRASGTSGQVVAEFVVDSAGRPELEHFGIVSSTNPHFVSAVRDAIARAVYTPAVRRGRPVRQLVRQPYEFVAPVRDRGRG